MTPKLLDQFGRPIKYGTGGIAVNKASYYSPKRQRFYGLSSDHSDGVSAYNRDTLMQIGRWLYANDNIIRGAVNEIATFSALNVTRIYGGANKEWGKSASDWLKEQDKEADIRGRPFSMENLARSYVVATYTDGDVYPLMVRDQQGQPRLQSLRAHRICGSDEKNNVFDGIGVDSYGRAVTYRMQKGGDKYEDIPAGAFIPLLLPDHCDQRRGVSVLATPSIAAQDLQESEAWELIAQKAFAALCLMEDSETGDAFDSAKSIVDGGASASGSGIAYEEMEGGIIRHFVAKSGAGIKAFAADRPSANQAEFVKRVTRSIMCSMMWPYEFAVDPTLAGGASMRIIIEKVNATINYVRECIVMPVYRSFDNFRIACAIQDGTLPDDKEWYKWAHYGPPPLTADKKYDADVDDMELKNCFTTLETICARNSRDWREVTKQRVAEEKFLQDECKAQGVELSRVKLVTPLELNPAKVSGQQAAPSAPQQDKPSK